MWALEETQHEQAQRGNSLTVKLNHFFENKVKIPKVEKDCCRRLVADYVEGHVIQYCREKTPFHLELEYTGSFYEGLKAEAANEVDLMVVVNAEPKVELEYTLKEGFVRFKYSDLGAYVIPERFRDGWFYSLISKATNKISSRSGVSFKVIHHGPAIELDIKEGNKKMLSVDLVPCLKTEAGEYYVPKLQSQSFLSQEAAHPFSPSFKAMCLDRLKRVPDHELLWRQSFSLEEKIKLKHMDKDGGCRKKLLKIVKTIVKREKTSLGKLTSFHLKTAFMRYIDQWDEQNSLADHFIAFLGELQKYLERKHLPHYRLDLNLLSDIDTVVSDKMANRLKRILRSEVQMNRVLCWSTLQSAECEVLNVVPYSPLPLTPEQEYASRSEHIPVVRLPLPRNRFDWMHREEVGWDENIAPFRFLHADRLRRTPTGRHQCSHPRMRHEVDILNEAAPFVRSPRLHARITQRERHHLPHVRLPREEDVIEGERNYISFFGMPVYSSQNLLKCRLKLVSRCVLRLLLGLAVMSSALLAGIGLLFILVSLAELCQID